MKKISILLLFIALSNSSLKAQNNIQNATPANPFLFSINTLTPNSPKWSINYSGSYGQRTSGPFGYDGLDQNFALKGYLGNKFTLYANAAVGFANAGGVRSAQQAEVIRDFIGGTKQFGTKLGLGLGMNRDWNGVGALFSRITASWDASKWRIGGNMVFEKAFSDSRDKLDFTTSIGFQHHLFGSLYAGFEAVGQDLEGFWEEDEAEGGARLMVGPSLNATSLNSKLGFSLSGGPVFYATRSNVIPSEALRSLNTQNGYIVRAMMTFNLHK